MADPFEVPDDRHARFLLNAGDEALSSARHDHIDAVRHMAQHMADGRPVGGRHQLNAGSRQTRSFEPLSQASMNRRARPGALRAAAQDHGVADFRHSAPASAVTLGGSHR